MALLRPMGRLSSSISMDDETVATQFSWPLHRLLYRANAAYLAQITYTAGGFLNTFHVHFYTLVLHIQTQPTYTVVAAHHSHRRVSLDPRPWAACGAFHLDNERHEGIDATRWR